MNFLAIHSFEKCKETKQKTHLLKFFMEELKKNIPGQHFRNRSIRPAEKKRIQKILIWIF
jgi:hypothetical protein